MEHRRLEYRHAFRAIVDLRMLAGERSETTPIAGARWGAHERADYPPIDAAELAELKTRIEDLVRKAADRVAS
jgi:hypothetical protein